MDTANPVDNNALLNKASSIVAITAHEFKTPLSTITAVVDLIAAKLQADGLMNSFYEKNLSRITSEIFSLNNMLDEMLTINNILSGSIETKKMVVAVESKLHTIKEQFQSFTKNDKILQINITGNPVPIFVSPVQLTHILTNLISNAFKYSRENDPVIHLHYKEKELEISIADDGIGIPEEDLPHLFEPYYRGSNTGGISGSGLGLAIVKTFVTANDGNITVHSKPGEGTVFTLTFRYPDSKTNS